MFFMLFFPNMEGRNNVGIKIKILSSFSSNTKSWNINKPAARAQHPTGALCFDQTGTGRKIKIFYLDKACCLLATSTK